MSNITPPANPEFGYFATLQYFLDLARQTPRVRGFMYTPWQKKYGLLPAFGDLLQAGR